MLLPFFFYYLQYGQRPEPPQIPHFTVGSEPVPNILSVLLPVPWHCVHVFVLLQLLQKLFDDELDVVEEVDVVPPEYDVASYPATGATAGIA